ncbi:MAG: type II toxin-antitoxin system RelE/ParE family toxin [Castellaniella sp.]|uniref:type II toxin-antitoxin system RelE/ParE family toxin n=1 Tax=Castellaniella sp. TaxID=1955812 RepID=UPI002A366AFA|nr:type II toxin-antitoxin system RelE/ParE family toxin [Castellaniella sp.]MDY0309931.1 type II toxin-antitoxin system RelE/ParE family toxin [Castellaniella sp.]
MAKSKTPYSVIWRPIAETDLDSIIDYIAQDSPARAKKFGQELRVKTKPLAEFPNVGRIGRPGLPDWLRELVVHKDHIIFYRVLDESRSVEILRAKHAAQQMP